MTILAARPQLRYPQRSATEAELVGKLVRALRRGWSLHSIGTEVRSHGRCRTDIAFRPRAEALQLRLAPIFGIEAKLTDWRGALRQAALNRYAVDASFIAMPFDKLHANVLEAAESYGVGILTLRDRDIEVIQGASLCIPDAKLSERMSGQLHRTRTRGARKVHELIRQAGT